jgi:CRP-like cAMP-binding protein
MVRKYLRPSGAIKSFVFSIPPRTRLLLGGSSLIAIVIVIVGQTLGHGLQLKDILGMFSVQLIQNFVEFAQVDNVVNFFGFTLLATVFTLGFKPSFWFPAWLGLVAAGYALTYFQFALEAPEVNPMKENLNQFVLVSQSAFFSAKVYGTLLGALLGAFVRGIYRFMRSELTDYIERKNTLIFKNGESIFNQGDMSDCLYVVQRGLVQLTHYENGETKNYRTIEPGEILGEIGVIENTPRYTTATAVGEVCAFRIDQSDLFKRIEGEEHPALLVARYLVKEVARNQRETGKALPDNENIVDEASATIKKF